MKKSYWFYVQDLKELSFWFCLLESLILLKAKKEEEEEECPKGRMVEGGVLTGKLYRWLGSSRMCGAEC